MKKTAFIIMLLTVLSKVIGFTRDITLSYFYGITSISDAYLISLSIPFTIFAFIGSGIATSYVPIYTDVKKSNGTKLADLFTNNVVNLILILCTILIIIGLLFTPQIVLLFASGFKDETLQLTVSFTRITIFGIYFSGLILLFSSYLRLKGNFIIPALIGVPLNIIVIASIVLSAKYNHKLLAYGALFAVFSQLLLLIPFIIKHGYKHKFTISIKNPAVKKMFVLAVPVILGTSVNQVNKLVDKTIASRITVGGISSLNLASRLIDFILGIFVISFVTVMYPTIAKMVSSNNISGFKKSIKETINGINILIVPATIGAMIFAKPIVSILFGRGAFDDKGILLTSSALLFYSIGMTGLGIRDVFARAFYSLQNTKTPMINAVFGMAVNIVLNIILSRYLGIGGLALATSISATLTAFLMYFSLRKSIGSLSIKPVIKSFFKILLASIIMGILAKLSFIIFDTFVSQNISLILAIIVGAVIYFVIIYFLKVDEVRIMINTLKNKVRRVT